MDYAKRDECIFITYNDIIKCTNFLLCKSILKYKEVYKDYLHLDLIENMSDMDLEMFLLSMNTENVFQYLARKSFNYEKTNIEFSSKIDNLYHSAPLLKIGAILEYICGNKFTKKVYLYSEEYDPRIVIDIEMMFKNNKKIEYVYGDFMDVVPSLKYIPTSYFLNHYMYVNCLYGLDMLAFTEIMIPCFKYNLREGDSTTSDTGVMTLKLETATMFTEDKPFKVATFVPFTIDPDVIARKMNKIIVK